LAVDSGKSDILPTITVQDVDSDTHADAHRDVHPDAHHDVHPDVQEDERTTPPGAISSRIAPAIPDWYKVGWRAFTDLDKPAEGDEQKRKRLFHTFLSDQFYGDWYHNAALIIFVRISLFVLANMRTYDAVGFRPCLHRISWHVFTSAGHGCSSFWPFVTRIT